MQGLEAGAAEFVECHGRNRERQAGEDRGLARWVLPRAGCQYLAEDHLIDLGDIQASLRQQLADHCGAQLLGGDAG
ncbi:hypothetical protein D3C85_1561200 [compost metagenome]